jgi:hypothetical protein
MLQRAMPPTPGALLVLQQTLAQEQHGHRQEQQSFRLNLKMHWHLRQAQQELLRHRHATVSVYYDAQVQPRRGSRDVQTMGHRDTSHSKGGEDISFVVHVTYGMPFHQMQVRRYQWTP